MKTKRDTYFAYVRTKNSVYNRAEIIKETPYSIVVRYSSFNTKTKKQVKKEDTIRKKDIVTIRQYVK